MSFSPSNAPNLAALGVALREATPEDGAFLTDLFVQVRSHVFAPLGMSSEQLKPMLDMQYQGRDRQYRADFPGAVTYILERAGEPVGACIMCSQPDHLRLIDISISLRFQSCGVGRALLTDLMNSCNELRLSVERLSRARRLYESLGFAETSSDGMYTSMTWASPSSDIQSASNRKPKSS